MEDKRPTPRSYSDRKPADTSATAVDLALVVFALAAAVFAMVNELLSP